MEWYLMFLDKVNEVKILMDLYLYLNHVSRRYWIEFFLSQRRNRFRCIEIRTTRWESNSTTFDRWWFLLKCSFIILFWFSLNWRFLNKLISFSNKEINCWSIYSQPRIEQWLHAKTETVLFFYSRFCFCKEEIWHRSPSKLGKLR
jgi:hypothetical protein